jgi:glutamyl-tRNA synthetase
MGFFFWKILNLKAFLIHSTYMNQKVVTRFAPSPTGYMHVGGVRTALFAFAWARKNKGTFILRIEDTDKEREVAGSIEHIMESLKWLGITWDEGPEINGPHAPYLQSQRLDSYKAWAQKLIEKGFAYPDPYTSEEVEVFRKQAEAEKRPFLFRDHRPSEFSVWDGTKPLRFKTPIKAYEWHDVVRGDLTAGVEAVDDFILIKSDGYPTYNFAHIIDDYEMGVTHIMRADEFISSTPKFLALYEALDITRPEFVTLPPILAPGGNKKLGKRDGAKDVLEYRSEGYLPEAIINFLAFLGWNPGDEREMMTREEFIEAFDIARIGKSGAQWNDEKLDWLNREHMKKLPLDEQVKRFISFLPETIKSLPGYTGAKAARIAPIALDRIQKFNDVITMASEGEFDYYFTKPTYAGVSLTWKTDEKSVTKNHLAEASKYLMKVDEDTFNRDEVKKAIWEYAESVGRGNVLWPIRVALSGREKSPDPFVLAELLGKEETLARLSEAQKALS